MADTTFLTQAGYDKLLQELQELQEEKLPAILARLKEAIEQGDISENAEYDTAMSEKELASARIAEIERILEDVEIIEHSAGGEVRYGSTVKLKDDKGNTHTVTIVGTGEVDVLENTVSFQSPIGQALRGKQKGDKVQVNAPQKKYAMTILSVN